MGESEDRRALNADGMVAVADEENENGYYPGVRFWVEGDNRDDGHPNFYSPRDITVDEDAVVMKAVNIHDLDDVHYFRSEKSDRYDGWGPVLRRRPDEDWHFAGGVLVRDAKRWHSGLPKPDSQDKHWPIPTSDLNDRLMDAIEPGVSIVVTVRTAGNVCEKRELMFEDDFKDVASVRVGPDSDAEQGVVSAYKCYPKDHDNPGQFGFNGVLTLYDEHPAVKQPRFKPLGYGSWRIMNVERVQEPNWPSHVKEKLKERTE